MNVVEPIRRKEDIEDIKEHLLEQKLYRDYCLWLFVVGINIGLRISDLSKLRWDQVYDKKGRFKDYIDIYEQKTGKFKRFKLNQSARDAIELYKENISPNMKREYLFNTRSNKDGYMTRKTAERILVREAKYVGLENIGTHSLRKTFGYHLRKNGVHISVIMKMFNHSSEMITLRYLGLLQDDMDAAIEDLNI